MRASKANNLLVQHHEQELAEKQRAHELQVMREAEIAKLTETRNESLYRHKDLLHSLNQKCITLEEILLDGLIKGQKYIPIPCNIFDETLSVANELNQVRKDLDLMAIRLPLMLAPFEDGIGLGVVKNEEIQNEISLKTADVQAKIDALVSQEEYDFTDELNSSLRADLLGMLNDDREELKWWRVSEINDLLIKFERMDFINEDEIQNVISIFKDRLSEEFYYFRILSNKARIKNKSIEIQLAKLNKILENLSVKEEELNKFKSKSCYIFCLEFDFADDLDFDAFLDEEDDFLLDDIGVSILVNLYSVSRVIEIVANGAMGRIFKFIEKSAINGSHSLLLSISATSARFSTTADSIFVDYSFRQDWGWVRNWWMHLFTILEYEVSWSSENEALRVSWAKDDLQEHSN